jgi:hypothetical protein
MTLVVEREAKAHLPIATTLGSIVGKLEAKTRVFVFLSITALQLLRASKLGFFDHM